ncbi:MAG: SDR family oxidoreductase [Myxococcales bacterium]|nr:SDR family oxidoreductase [Myxococcales bacterium]MCB9752585.1 SDR family oxidoreductase [Myxococcales bacterium]
MTTENAPLSNTAALIIGATRGLGRGIALALARAGATVTAVGRSEDALASLELEGAGRIDVVRGDATDAALARALLRERRPNALFMVAGATPRMAPLRDYTWEQLSAPWTVDVKAAFVWLQAVLTTPMAAGGRVVLVSSGAALHGSPLSGGYAGAKQTQRFLAQYARGEAEEAGLELRVQCLLPQLNPNTALGRAGVEAYAARAGLDPETFVARRFGDTPLSPARAGQAAVELLRDPSRAEPDEFMLLGEGLRALPSKG